jgi:hypothetical protein
LHSICHCNIDLNNLNNLGDDQPTELKSIPLLQSLKNDNKQLQFRAPYVHELKNRYKVRTLFVESQNLPIIDIQLTFNAGSARDEEIAAGLYVLPIWLRNCLMKEPRSIPLTKLPVLLKRLVLNLV